MATRVPNGGYTSNLPFKQRHIFVKVGAPVRDLQSPASFPKGKRNKSTRTLHAAAFENAAIAANSDLKV
jgi:hypothetical protein